MTALIVYFSRSGNNYVNGSIINLPIGNTEAAANMLAEITKADIFKLEPVKPYSEDYTECTKEAAAYKKQNTRPALKALPESISQYDTIYIGYPNYWGTMPMEMFTFLDAFDFGGKTIKPFCTHEGSGMGASESDLKKLCPTALVKMGLAIKGSEVSKAKSALEKWSFE